MRIIDISYPVQEAPLYPGSEPPRLTPICEIAKGALYNASLLTTGSHIGTHADACTHFLAQGATINEMPLAAYYGPCRLVSIDAGRIITAEDLPEAAFGCERLLLRTQGLAYLDVGAAKALYERGLRTVLTDAMSVAPPENEADVHRFLLTAGVAIVENLDLRAVADGDYILSAFPVKLKGCDGAPVRAVLIAQD